jgi:2-polyprenyl-6-methoxyphenol hydroxylase-like FAD-dependent oxidoreductase
VDERMMEDRQVVVVGASLAGCTAAMLLARAGVSVTVVEQRPDPAAFKRICGHFIQASAVPTLRRLGLLDAIEAAGAVRGHFRLRTPWGVVTPPAGTALEPSLNIRREVLDPLVRAQAAATPGVELLLGKTARELVHANGRVAGVVAAGRDGSETALRARLVVAADGRDSRVAKLAGVRERRFPHGRFSYGAYYEGPPAPGAPDGTLWLTDPGWAAAFPTDAGLTLYACMPTHEHLPAFREDLPGALEAYLAALPDPPPIAESRRVSPVIGKLDMENVWRDAAMPGLALVGDAALATDPVWGVGCGWALQSGEWLADAVVPALRAEGSLDRALRRYARTHRRRLGLHARLIHGYATGRPLDATERLLFSAAARDPGLAEIVTEFGTRSISPVRMGIRVAPLLARRAVCRRPRRSSGDQPLEQVVELGGGVVAQPGVDG